MHDVKLLTALYILKRNVKESWEIFLIETNNDIFKIKKHSPQRQAHSNRKAEMHVKSIE